MVVQVHVNSAHPLAGHLVAVSRRVEHLAAYLLGTVEEGKMVA